MIIEIQGKKGLVVFQTITPEVVNGNMTENSVCPSVVVWKSIDPPSFCTAVFVMYNPIPPLSDLSDARENIWKILSGCA